MILISFCGENGSGHCVQHFPAHLHCCELFACGMIRRTAIGREKKPFSASRRCVNLPVVSLLFVSAPMLCACACKCALGGIMTDQT